MQSASAVIILELFISLCLYSCWGTGICSFHHSPRSCVLPSSSFSVPGCVMSSSCSLCQNTPAWLPEMTVMSPRGCMLPLLLQNQSLLCQVTAVLVGREPYGSTVQLPLEQSHPQHHPRAAGALSSWTPQNPMDGAPPPPLCWAPGKGIFPNAQPKLPSSTSSCCLLLYHLVPLGRVWLHHICNCPTSHCRLLLDTPQPPFLHTKPAQLPPPLLAHHSLSNWPSWSHLLDTVHFLYILVH